MDMDPKALRILELARDARTPGAADKARIERQLSIALGASAGLATIASLTAASTSTAALKSSSGTLALKYWIGSGVLAATLATGIAGYVALSRSPVEPASMPAAKPPIVAPAVAPHEPTAAPAVDLSSAPASAANLDAPEPEHAAHPSSTRRTTPSSLGQEIELLHGAQAAWRTHEAPRALALIEQHRERFPRSALRLEREGLQVLALCEVGRKAEAKALARSLLARAPRSPLRGSIEESCALK